MMAEDFNSAAVRHWNDANFLANNGRDENADHLIGFSVECAIKMVIENAGLLVRKKSGLPEIRHLPNVWEQAKMLSIQTLPLYAVLSASTPFSNWDVGQRYVVTGSIANAVMQEHLAAGKDVLLASGVLS